MDGNFSNRVQDVIRHSREEALRLGDDYIGTEHFLLGLIKEGECIATRILKNLNVDLFRLKQKTEESIHQKAAASQMGNVPLTRQAEKVLKITYLEAKICKSNVIGTEHLLLSILKVEDNVAAQILEQFGVSYDAVRDELEKIIDEDNKVIVNEPNEEKKNKENEDIDLLSKTEQKIDIWIDIGDASVNDLVELYDSLSELHRAFGGTGIVFRDDMTKIHISKEVLV